MVELYHILLNTHTEELELLPLFFFLGLSRINLMISGRNKKKTHKRKGRRRREFWSYLNKRNHC